MRALIVLTNVEKYPSADRLTGLWLSELTHFYDELVKAGIEADFISPKGGYVPLDPHSLINMDETDYHYYADEVFRDRSLGNTLKPSQVKAEDYDLIYYTGGHGTMWDFPQAEEIADIAAVIYQSGGYISAVCHGTAGLLPIKAEDGSALISGRVVTGFTNEEEALNGTGDLVPFLTENALRERGAAVEAAKAFTPAVRRDGRLLTGQNPQSARQLGELVAEVLRTEKGLA